MSLTSLKEYLKIGTTPPIEVLKASTVGKVIVGKKSYAEIHPLKFEEMLSEPYKSNNLFKANYYFREFCKRAANVIGYGFGMNEVIE